MRKPGASGTVLPIICPMYLILSAVQGKCALRPKSDRRGPWRLGIATAQIDHPCHHRMRLLII
jgi:hypothetical protein